jgi:hypothetical protein
VPWLGWLTARHPLNHVVRSPRRHISTIRVHTETGKCFPSHRLLDLVTRGQFDRMAKRGRQRHLSKNGLHATSLRQVNGIRGEGLDERCDAGLGQGAWASALQVERPR